MTSMRHIVTCVFVLAAGVALGWHWRSAQLNDDYQANAPKHRPKGLPDSAVWSGGLDGGSYIDCYYNKQTERDDCTIYNDYTGNVMGSGSYVLEGQTHGAKPDQLKYAGTDWQSIFLKLPIQNGREPALVRVDK